MIELYQIHQKLGEERDRVYHLQKTDKNADRMQSINLIQKEVADAIDEVKKIIRTVDELYKFATGKEK